LSFYAVRDKDKERCSGNSEDVVELLPKSPLDQEKGWGSGSDDEVVYDNSKL